MQDDITKAGRHIADALAIMQRLYNRANKDAGADSQADLIIAALGGCVDGLHGVEQLSIAAGHLTGAGSSMVVRDGFIRALPAVKLRGRNAECSGFHPANTQARRLHIDAQSLIDSHTGRRELDAQRSKPGDSFNLGEPQSNTAHAVRSK